VGRSTGTGVGAEKALGVRIASGASCKKKRIGVVLCGSVNALPHQGAHRRLSTPPHGSHKGSPHPKALSPQCSPRHKAHTPPKALAPTRPSILGGPHSPPPSLPPTTWPWLMMHSHGCNAHRMYPTHHRPVAVDELHSGSAPKLMRRPPLVTTTATDTVAMDVTHSADSVEPTSSMKRCCSHTWSSSSVFALSP